MLSPAPTAKNAPQLCVYMIAASRTANSATWRRRRSTNPRTNAPAASSPSSTTSAYMRVSIACTPRNGLNAATAAAARAGPRPHTSAAQYAAGIASSVKTSESWCVTTSRVPNSSVQTCSSM
jgi:hypothetical protein